MQNLINIACENYLIIINPKKNNDIAITIDDLYETEPIIFIFICTQIPGFHKM